MKDVAERAGVARSTVSMALRDDTSIPAATRRRIQKLAEEMGYRPNPLVSALMAGLRTGRKEIRHLPLAYVSSFSEEEERTIATLNEFRQGAREHAARLGYSFDDFRIDRQTITPDRLRGILQARGIPGFILAPIPHPLSEFEFDWSSFAAVAIGHSLKRPQLHRVVHHQYHGMILALENLRRLGFRRPGLVLTSDLDRRVDHNWTAAFLLTQMPPFEAGKTPLLIAENLTKETFGEWFKRNRPDAIITVFPQVAEWLPSLGVSVPGDVGFVSLDRSPGMRWPGIDQNSRLVAAAAVDLLVEQLYHNRYGLPETPKTVLIEGRWVDPEADPSEPEKHSSPRKKKERGGVPRAPS